MGPNCGFSFMPILQQNSDKFLLKLFTDMHVQVSMLEIYNEAIRDLLATNKSTFDAGKQYAIKHDANGNTYVSDLTIIDVRSSREVAYLLERAAQSRY